MPSVICFIWRIILLIGPLKTNNQPLIGLPYWMLNGTLDRNVNLVTRDCISEIREWLFFVYIHTYLYIMIINLTLYNVKITDLRARKENSNRCWWCWRLGHRLWLPNEMIKLFPSPEKETEAKKKPKVTGNIVVFTRSLSTFTLASFRRWNICRTHYYSGWLAR